MIETLETIKRPQIAVRDERPSDIAAIHAINVAAFNGVGEAAVVARLRSCCHEFVSLIAEIGGMVVGHILFTPVTVIGSAGTVIIGMGLAPLTVLPEYQCQGVGTALCQTGLTRVQNSGKPFVVVLGEPAYYTRFGFEPARHHAISATFPDIPANVFMIKTFVTPLLSGESGVAHYHPEFDAVS